MVVFVSACEAVSGDVVVGEEEVVVGGIWGGVDVGDWVSVAVGGSADFCEVVDGAGGACVDGEDDVNGRAGASKQCRDWCCERGSSVGVVDPAGVSECESCWEVVDYFDVRCVDCTLVFDGEGEGDGVARRNGSEVGPVGEGLEQCKVEDWWWYHVELCPVVVVFVSACEAVSSNVVVCKEHVVVDRIWGGVGVWNNIAHVIHRSADLCEVVDGARSACVDGEHDVDGGACSCSECWDWCCERGGSVGVVDPVWIGQGQTCWEVVDDVDVCCADRSLVLDCEGESDGVSWCDGCKVAAVSERLEQCEVEDVASAGAACCEEFVVGAN